MSKCKRIMSAILPPVAGGLSLASAGAATGACAGYIGGLILKGAGWEGVDPIEATQMGAVGGAVLGSGMGVIMGAAINYLSNKQEGLDSCEQADMLNKTASSSSLNIAIGSAIGGLIGYGILTAAGVPIGMTVGQTAAAAAVGGIITACPAACAIAGLVACIGAPIAAAIFKLKDEQTPILGNT